MSESWAEAARDLAPVLQLMRPGQFAFIKCGVDVDPEDFPYVQAARLVDGWYCEVVSQAYLPATAWPFDELAFRRLEWLPPVDRGNWHREVAPGRDVADRLLAGLRYGRACPARAVVRWWVGTFPLQARTTVNGTTSRTPRSGAS